MQNRSCSRARNRIRAEGRVLFFAAMSTLSGLACAGDEPVLSLRNTQNQPAPIDDRNQLPAYVAQCEAVLGKIPEISCDPANPAPFTTVRKIPVFVEGKLLGFDEELSDGEREQLAERAEHDSYTCDFPSLGGDFPCTVGSTLVHHEDTDNPNVQWVALCRGVPWDNPSYDRFTDTGLIGYNEGTGEMCFFFGHNPEPDEPLELPELTSASDSSLEPWLPPAEMLGSCISCHPNNDPWILTPWLMPGYMPAILGQSHYPLQLPAGVQLEDVMAASSIRTTPTSSQLILPTPLPAGRTSWTEEEIFDDEGNLAKRQLRIVGSGYVSTESAGHVLPRSGMRPESWSTGFRERIRLKPLEDSCSGPCHAMGNEHWLRLATDAMGHGIAASQRTGHFDHFLPEFRWMDYAKPYEPAQLDEDEFTVPAITECPIPKQVDDAPEVYVQCEPVDGHDGAVRITWHYDNDFGEVPDRDDVRFDVAFGRAEEIPVQTGTSTASEREGVRMSASPAVVVLRDVAPDGDEYQLVVPFERSQARLRVALQPKRFCFEEPDRRPFAYAPPYWVDVDVAAACGR